MQKKRAFYAGLNGALAMAVLVDVVPFQLLPQNLGLMLGSFVLREVSLSTWAFGLVMHLCLGGLAAMGYMLLFERVLHRSGWLTGMLIGTAHALLVGPLLALVPAVHPLVPEVLPAPGPYLMNMGGLGVLAFFAAHLLFGVIVGGIYADLPLPSPRHTGELRV